MKFSLCTYQTLRQIIGFGLLGLINYMLIPSNPSSLQVFFTIFANSIGLFSVLKFASEGSLKHIEFDFRTEEEKITDDIKHKHEMIEAGMNNLIMKAVHGEISQAKLKDSLQSLEEIKIFIDSQAKNRLLAVPKEEEDDDSFLNMPTKKEELTEEQVFQILNQKI